MFTKRFLLLGLFWGVKGFSVFSQQALGVYTAEAPITQAVLAFQEGRSIETCPQFDEWKEQIRSKASFQLTPAEQEIIFYSLECGLSANMPQAVLDAFQFLSGSPILVYKDRLHAALARYYFRTQQWASCVEQYRSAGIVHFSNQEIAQGQFQQGYAFFQLKQFLQAKSFFNSVRSLPEHPDKAAATYYYGLILFQEKNWSEAMLQFRLMESDSVYGSHVPLPIAQILLQTDRTEEAIRYVLQRQKQSPAPLYQSELQQVLGQAYFSKKDYQQSLFYFNAFAKKADTLSAEDRYRIAYGYYKTDQPTQAITLFRQLSEQADSLGQQAMFLLGDISLQQGDLIGARNAFLFCALHSMNRLQREAARFFHAKLSYQLGFFDEALSGLKVFLDTYPASSFLQEAKELQLAVLASTSNYKEALSVLDQLSIPSESAKRLFAPVLYGRAAELINDGEWKAADTLLSRALTSSGNTALLPYLYFWKGELAFRGELFSQAVGFFQQYLQKGAPSVGDIQPQHARYSLAYAHTRLNRYEEALPLFQSLSSQATAQSSTLIQDALCREADCLLMLKRYPQAMAAYQKVIDFAWRDADYALYQLATIAGLKSTREKIKLLRGFEQSFPGSSLLTSSWMALADTYLQDELFTEAKLYLEKIIQNENSALFLPPAYFKLGVVYYNLGNRAAARESFSYLLDHYANAEEATDALENLKMVYVEEGRAADFVNFIKSKGLSITSSQEDSLQFSAAEVFYNNQSFEQAKLALENYLSSYDHPAFFVEAHTLLAQLFQQQKDFDGALLHFDSVLQVSPNRYAEEAALQAARICFFDQKKYDRAILYYEQLNKLTGLASSKLEALRGLVRGHYLLGQFESSASWGAMLMNEKGYSADDKAIVSLANAKVYIAQGKEEEAQLSLKQAISLNKGSVAAEARYEMAQSHFRKGKYEVAEKAALETINKSGSYGIWVTRAYLLLGDIYFARADYFNAKATFQSIKDSDAIEELKKEATDKLDKVIKAEPNGSKAPKKQ